MKNRDKSTAPFGYIRYRPNRLAPTWLASTLPRAGRK